MQNPDSPPRFPWLRLTVTLALVALFAVSRLLKNRRENDGWDADHITITLVLWAIASAIVVAIMCFLHWRTTRQR